MNNPCPFCNLEHDRIIDETSSWFVVRDGFPVSAGHTLIIPKRHVSTFFELDKQEFDELYDLINKEKHALDNEYQPAGYNIGVNNGEAAGQTVFHLHIHLIPRYEGDREDPRGGVRWILPDKADYWSGQ